MTRRARALTALLLATLLASPTGALAQEGSTPPGPGAPAGADPNPPADPAPTPYDLTPHYQLGERQEVEARLSILLEVRVRVPSVKLDRTSEQEQVVHRRYRDELHTVRDGKVAEVRRVFLEAWSGVREPGERALRRSLDPLHQRRIVVGLDARGERRVTVPQGDPPLPAAAVADELHTERWEAVLPREPLALGAEWIVEGEPMRRALGAGLGHEPTGRITCRLLEVREEALDEDTPAERYAVIGVEVRVAGRQSDAPDAPRLSTDLEGRLRFSLRRRKLVTIDLRGTARLRQTREEEGAVLEVDGRGPVAIRKRVRFPADPAPERPR